MTTLSPYELAACRVEFEKYVFQMREFRGYSPDVLLAPIEFIWETAKDQATAMFYAGLSHARAESAKEIEELKAQVEGMRSLLERVSRILSGSETEDQGEAYDLAHRLIDSAIAQEKQNG